MKTFLWKWIRKQTKKLLKNSKMNLTMDNAITSDVSSHYSLNSKKEIMTCSEKGCTGDEIFEYLKDEGVVKLDRIFVFRNEQRNPTWTWSFKDRPYQNTSWWVTTGWLCQNLSLILSDAINVKSLVTLNSTAERMKFAIIEGTNIIQTLGNAQII